MRDNQMPVSPCFEVDPINSITALDCSRFSSGQLTGLVSSSGIRFAGGDSIDLFRYGVGEPKNRESGLIDPSPASPEETNCSAGGSLVAREDRFFMIHGLAIRIGRPRGYDPAANENLFLPWMDRYLTAIRAALRESVGVSLHCDQYSSQYRLGGVETRELLCDAAGTGVSPGRIKKTRGGKKKNTGMPFWFMPFSIAVASTHEKRISVRMTIGSSSLIGTDQQHPIPDLANIYVPVRAWLFGSESSGRFEETGIWR